MGENIVERVARIIDPHAFDPQEKTRLAHLFGCFKTATERQSEARAIAMGTARKILAALREPSDAMIEAGEMCDAADVWRSMIDAALTEGNE